MWLKKGQKLGEGGFGTVYSATAENSCVSSSTHPAIMAVKAVELKYSDSLKWESRILKSLKGNPYIVEAYGVDISSEGRDRMMYNLLMEIADGSLKNLIKEYKGNMAEPEVAQYTFMLLKGLSYIHGQGIIHCDIKPENILVFHDEVGRYGFLKLKFLKLADFGLSKILSYEHSNSFRGTPNYAAPESVENGMQGASADIWSAGCTVLYMINGGQLIWKDRKHWELKIPDRLSPEAKDFLMRCLQLCPRSRSTADELLKHPFIQENLGWSIPTIETLQRDLRKNNPLSGSWTVTRGRFSPMPGIETPMPPH